MFKLAFALPTLALSVLVLCAPGTTPQAQAQIMYIGTNTTLDASDPITGQAFVGFASANDFSHNTNRVSPTVTLVSGGSVSNAIQIYNSSTLNMSGGMVGGPSASVNAIVGYDNSRVNLSGGSVIGRLSSYANSTTAISGGSIGERLEAGDNSTVTISGGSVGGILNAFTNGTINLSGGSVGGYFRVDNSGTLNVFGTGLNALLINSDFSFAPNDPTMPSRYSQYSLSGALSDGTVLLNKELDVQNGTGARYFLFNTPGAVPEPGSLALFAGLCVTGAGIFTRRKRRK